MPAKLPPLVADSRALKQILLNLLSNAVKFTPGGGTVTVSAMIRPQGDLELTVMDTGIGMSPEEIDIAMSQFGQVDSAFSRRFEGTGLGLPLTQRLIEMHGGTIELESEKGVGTTVMARFPAERVVRTQSLIGQTGVH
jgi:signal transduction histidine kinase